MRIISLDSEDWELSCSDTPSCSIPAMVPGNVSWDLWRAGLRPDPYVGRGTEAYRGLEEKSWTYRRTFRLPDRAVSPAWYLIFNGLDYHAKIFLNGQLLGEHEGQMGQVIFSVAPALREDNELVVTFLPLSKAPLPSRAWIDPFCPTRHAGRWLAKSLMSFGWDIAPELIPVGIWQSVWLIGTGGPLLRDPRIDQTFDADFSRVEARFVLEYLCEAPRACLLRLQLFDPQDRPVHLAETPVSLTAGAGQIELSAEISSPQLWWPNGLGTPTLYRARAELLAGEESLARQEFSVGFRSLRMVRSRSDEAEKFPLPSGARKWETCFVVNDVPFFCRGSNWVPPDILYGRISDERLARLIELAKEAHINLLRVWGGGIVLPEAFYRFADEAGILIWQEFPLGCTDHSGNEHYAAVLEKEARNIVRRLRHHPCLALWCGGNELLQDHSGMAPQDKVLRMLQTVCYEEDPNRPFLLSTPYPGALHGPYSFDGAGSNQNLFDQVDFCNHLENAAYNECGVAGPAHADTMRRVLPPEELWPPRRGTAWEFHKAFQAWGNGNAWLNLELIEEYFGPLADPEELAQAGQFLQSIGLQYLLEELRRRWPDVPGTIQWCFNESWTSLANCSVVAYPDRPKPAYEALKRAYQPVDISARLEHFVLLPGETTSLTPFLLNDTRSAVPTGSVQITVENLSDGRRNTEYSAPAPPVLPGSRRMLPPLRWTAGTSPGVFRARLEWRFGAEIRGKNYWFGLGSPSDSTRRNPNQAFRPLFSFWRNHGFEP